MVNKKIVFSPVIGLWTIPLVDLFRLLQDSEALLPDWMDSDEDIVVTARIDNNAITFIGRLVGEER